MDHKAKAYLILVTVLLGLSALGHAAESAALKETASLNVIGFSRSARYLAFEDYGYTDGATGSYSSIYVVDAAKDEYAHAPFKKRVVEVAEAKLALTRAQNLRAAMPTLKKLGIRIGNVGAKQKLSFSDEVHRTAAFSYKGKMYGLHLYQKQFPSSQCALGEKTFGFELILQAPTGGVDLHRDTQVPSTRGVKGCVRGYAIHSVRVDGDKLAVFLTVSQPGFEGSDTHHMVVAKRVF